MPKKQKRVLIVSDFHSGHAVGLTPPSWLDTPSKTASPARLKLARYRKFAYEKFHTKIKELQPIDILLVNGDCIDGREEKSGGSELIAVDRDDQCDMASELIRFIKAKKIVMTYGTPYHCGSIEDYENKIAREVKAEKIGGHEWVSVNGLIFDLKHKVGSSSIPHGRFTAIAKEKLWNLLWSEREESPKSDIIIRSHVHYHNYCGGNDWLAMTTPALQGPGSKFGIRECTGVVDFGLVCFDVNISGNYSWQAYITKMLDKKNMLLKL